MHRIQKFPATVVLIAVNCVVFLFTWYQAGSFDEPGWSLFLLKAGAEFNPLSLDQEPHRLLTHMFLHGGWMHIAFNMYALYIAGSDLEQGVGTVKFLWIYFLSGFAAALSSLYFGLFTIGVGASGAIFGIFGATVVINVIISRKMQQPIRPILTNFLIFLGINLLFAKAFHADNAAHIGGLVAGIVLTGLTYFTGSFRTVRAEYALLPLLVIIYFLLPRYQVTYFKFFEKVLSVEDSTQVLFDRNPPNDVFVKAMKRIRTDWDQALVMLERQSYIPGELQEDTLKLKKYIRYRQQENDFRITMVERESYIYQDSIAYVEELMTPVLHLDHPLLMMHTRPQRKAEDETKEEEKPALHPAKVYYDKDWVEIPGPDGVYYREGARDSLGRWQGPVADYYKDGTIQMKGTYRDDRRNGIFIYYSDHHTYTSAGRYRDDRSIGKWESFHENGRMKSEEFFTPEYFLKNQWDSLGHPEITNGHGHVKETDANGVVRTEGTYEKGRKEGTWLGRHADGTTYFEEFFNRGQLIRGRSRSVTGQTFVYDASIYFPIPQGGWVAYRREFQQEVKKNFPQVRGTLRLSFLVTASGTVTDVHVEKGISTKVDEKATEIVRNGKRWIPAREHGQEPVSGYDFVEVEW